MNIRNTRQRQSIKEAFEVANRPLSADEVLAAAQSTVSGLGMATVYRAIKTGVEDGWLVAVELPGAPPRYEIAGKEHHHHFHCNTCGKVFELHGCVENLNKMLPKGFRVTGHEVLLYGSCSECTPAQQ